MYKRIRLSYDIALINSKIPKNYDAKFNQFATACGDPLAVMNTTKAFSVMDQARIDAKDGYWFAGFTLVYMVIEFVVIVVWCICLCKGHVSTSSNSQAQEIIPPVQNDKEIELE